MGPLFVSVVVGYLTRRASNTGASERTKRVDQSARFSHDLELFFPLHCYIQTALWPIGLSEGWSRCPFRSSLRRLLQILRHFLESSPLHLCLALPSLQGLR